MPGSAFHQAGFRGSCHKKVGFVAILHLFCSQTGDSWLAFCDLHWIVGAGGFNDGPSFTVAVGGLKMGPYLYQLYK